MVVPPENVLNPVSCSVPAPVFTKAPEPERMAVQVSCPALIAKVRLPDAKLVASETVCVALDATVTSPVSVTALPVSVLPWALAPKLRPESVRPVRSFWE